MTLTLTSHQAFTYLRPRLARGQWIIAIGGRSGAGKSTFARTLSLHIPGASIFPLESCYHGWRGLLPGIADATRLISTIRHGARCVAWPKWDWHQHRAGAPTLRPVPRVVLLEGVGADFPPLAALADVVIHCTAPSLTRRERVQQRDGDWDFAWETWARYEDVGTKRIRPHIWLR